VDQKTGRKKRNKGNQSRKVLTVNGSIRLVRRWWHSEGEGSVAPADEFIDVEEQSVSMGVREMACRLNNDSHNFDRTAENLAHTARIKMSGERLRQLVIDEGTAVLRAQKSGQIPTAFQSKECLVDPQQPQGNTRIYVGVDGVMVPIITDAEKQKRRKTILFKRRRCGQKRRPLAPRKKGADRSYKEFKTIIFYDEHGRFSHHALLRIKRTASGAAVRREAKRLDFASADERIGIVDGARWIESQLQEQPLPLDGLGLDFYHLSENVHRCRRLVFGDKAEEGQIWAGNLLQTFKHDGFASALDVLIVWIALLRGKTKRAAAKKLLKYVSERKDMINYPEFRAKGWQIGSGPTESRCKTTTSRLKGRGRRWDGPNAEAVAALTTLMDSGQWQLYWKQPYVAKT
jgi:hypothetical protein